MKTYEMHATMVEVHVHLLTENFEAPPHLNLKEPYSRIHPTRKAWPQENWKDVHPVVKDALSTAVYHYVCVAFKYIFIEKRGGKREQHSSDIDNSSVSWLRSSRRPAGQKCICLFALLTTIIHHIYHAPPPVISLILFHFAMRQCPGRALFIQNEKKSRHSSPNTTKKYRPIPLSS